MTNRTTPLAGLRVIESSLLGPAAITTHLADLGAEVIKIESPAGDYVREMTWPIIEGVSLLHLHVNRGKKSMTLDLKTKEGVEIYLDLVRDADIVVEAMRPGSLARLGLGFEDLRAVNPKIVFINISGYGMTGPYRDLPSHGIAFDTWAGIVNPAYDEDGFCVIPEHASIGMHAGPMFGALGVLAAVIRARETGEGCMLEIGQSDAAAYMDWYRSESWLAYERPESEVTGNKADNYERRAPGTAGMKEGVRYQMYEASDGHVLFMASERAFWENFAKGVGRPELFEKWPGSKFADHARGNQELHRELREIFKTKTCAEWIEFGNTENTPIAPVNTPKSITGDPQFQARFPLYPAKDHGADMLPFPVKFLDEELPPPTTAPTVGEHNDQVLTEVLGYDAERVKKLKDSGGARIAVGRPCILFAHGAGAGSAHVWMQAWRERLAAFAETETFDYPYMQRGGRGPDRLPVLIESHRSALEKLRSSSGGPLVLAGKSMGSRVGCHLSLEEPVEGLVCFGYPLRGAGKNPKLRDEVLLALDAPILFIQGTRDKLCPLELLDEVRAKMKAPSELFVVEAGDHSLQVTKTQLKNDGETQDEVDARICAVVKDFVLSR